MKETRDCEDFRHYERNMETAKALYDHFVTLCKDTEYFKKQPLYKQILWKIIK